MATNGLVHITTATFTTQASVSIDNCFSASYTHYLVKRNVSGTADANVALRLRVSATDDSGTNYRYQRIDGSGVTVSGARGTGQTSWAWGLGTINATETGYSETWISNPFEAVRTTVWVDTSQTIAGNIVALSLVFAHDLTTSYDSMTIFPSSGTISGDVEIWGLVKA